MDEVEFYLMDLKSKFDKIKPNTYYLSYSGGKDSHLLYWFIKEYLKRDDIKIVGINTYMEHHEIRDRILKNSDIVLQPKLKPMEIKKKYGSPCFSKIQDDFIDRYQRGSRSKSLMERIYSRKFIGKDEKIHKSSFSLNKQARELLLNGKLHRISPKCCKYLKKEPAKQCEKEYRLKNREKYNNYMKEYYKNNKEELLQKSKIYRENNKEEIKMRDKIYREIHKRERNERELKRKKEDSIYKLKCNIRGMIKNSFRRRGFEKKQKGEKIYGCTVNELIEHLIKTYEDNYNENWKWKYLKDVHVDHIIPLANANTEEEVVKLCHYTNLQLLKAKDNLDKKDKLDWSLNDE